MKYDLRESWRLRQLTMQAELKPLQPRKALRYESMSHTSVLKLLCWNLINNVMVSSSKVLGPELEDACDD